MFPSYSDCWSFWKFCSILGCISVVAGRMKCLLLYFKDNHVLNKKWKPPTLAVFVNVVKWMLSCILSPFCNLSDMGWQKCIWSRTVDWGSVGLQYRCLSLAHLLSLLAILKGLQWDVDSHSSRNLIEKVIFNYFFNPVYIFKIFL